VSSSFGERISDLATTFKVSAGASALLKVRDAPGLGAAQLDGPFGGATRYLAAPMVYIVLGILILLGLGVFFVAMGGGPRGARDSLHSESKGSRRLLLLGVVVLFAFGIAVPAFVLADNGKDKASEAVGGVHLNGEETKGRELFARACTACHTLAAVKSVGRIGPDLDVRVGVDISTFADRRALVENAIEEGRARGLGQMPAMLYVGKEAEDVAKFVAAVAGH
jgi:mono/diheme cytochrome c family protein